MSSSAIAEVGSPMIVHQIAGWNGVRLARWSALPGELAEQSYSDHEINIPLAGSFTSVKHTAVGDRRHCHNDAAGAICIVPANQPIAARWRDKVDCVTVALKPALVARAAFGEHSPAHVELIETYDAEDHLIREIGLALLAEAMSNEPLGRLYAESLANTLAMHLVRRYSVPRLRQQSSRGGLTGKRLRRAAEFINEHLGQDLTLADIAESAGLSQYHFARAFKQTTGLTPQQYLTERRVERAKHLLTASDLPLVEVAAIVGFKNQSHFTTLFRRFTHITPKAWRDSRIS